jgi:hypothetical protein
MWEVIYWALKALLGFVFSGSYKTETHRVAGVQGLDTDTLADAVPKLCLILCLLTMVGCTQSFFGRSTTEQIALVAAGGFVEIAQDEFIEIEYSGKKEMRNMAGAYVIPKRIYDALQERYEKKHPKTSFNLEALPYVEVCDSTIESGTVVIAEQVPTSTITSTRKITIIATSTIGKIIRSSRRLTGMVAMSKSTYELLTKGE